MPKNTSERKNKRTSDKFDIPKNPNLIIHIENMKFKVLTNDEVYSKEDTKKLKKLISKLSKNIWIDRTYVCFKGNRFKDSFIIEDKWHDFCRLAISDMQGKRISRDKRDDITSALVAMCTVYLYQIADKYGYDTDDIDISVENGKFSTEYFMDRRSTWNF